MTDFYGGGGGFDGGGFEVGGSSQGQGQGQGSPSADKRAGDRSEQTMIPVTIKQIVDAESLGETFAIDGKPFYQVNFVAVIRDVVEHSTNVAFSVEDGTGHISTKIWVDESESDANAVNRAGWKCVTSGGGSRLCALVSVAGGPVTSSSLCLW